MSVSVLSFLQVDAPIDSPRSLEACLRQGIDPMELRNKVLNDFTERGKGMLTYIYIYIKLTITFIQYQKQWQR